MLSNNHNNLCKAIFKILSCNLLWIIYFDNDNKLRILPTDVYILNYYLEKKYYLYDNNIKFKLNNVQVSLNIALGTDSSSFNKSGFLYDLYKMFHIEEFVSIATCVNSEQYCFRFFTRNNRFIFMSKLLNNMPIIKYFINVMIENLNDDLYKQISFNLK